MAAAAVLAAAVALAAGTRDEPAPPPAGQAAAPTAVSTPTVKPRKAVALIGGKALQSARCRQWKGASARERTAIVTTLQVVIGGPTPYGQASALPPADATALFDRACSRSYARSFLLYELYSRASAFQQRKPQL